MREMRVEETGMALDLTAQASHGRIDAPRDPGKFVLYCM